jgi:hypothetical protein
MRRGATASAAALLLLGLLAAPAAAAGAADAMAADGRAVSAAALARARSDCPATWFCVWADANFSRGPGKWQNDEHLYGRWTTSQCPSSPPSRATWNDCASSVYNHGDSCRVTFYENEYFNETPGAFFYQLPRGSYLANLAQNTWSDGTSPNDKISSHKWFC